MFELHRAQSPLGRESESSDDSSRLRLGSKKENHCIQHDSDLEVQPDSDSEPRLGVQAEATLLSHRPLSHCAMPWQ